MINDIESHGFSLHGEKIDAVFEEIVSMVLDFSSRENMDAIF